MKLTIEDFTTSTGWSGSGGPVVHGLNEWPQFIAGLLDKSLIFSIPSGSNNGYIEKTIDPAIDVSNYTELVFHTWSRNKKSYGNTYRKKEDFVYKIEFGGAVQYFMPTYNGFYDTVIDISDVTSISKIRITALHNDADYIIMSNMLAVYNELPLDIFLNIKEQLEYDTNKFYGTLLPLNGVQNKGIPLGAISASAGKSKFIIKQGLPFLEKYSVIRIDDNVNSEIHQIETTDERHFTFNDQFDGNILLNSYTNANVYLTLPVGINPKEEEIMLPGMFVWGMTAEEIFRNKEDILRDTMKSDDTVKSRIVPTIFNYTVQVHCEARQDELIAYMSKIVRTMIAKEFVWISGRKIDIIPEGSPEYIEPTEGYNQIPKIVYTLRLEVKEEVFDREEQVRTSDITINTDSKALSEVL